MACGLTIMSGTTPLEVVGISIDSIIKPTVPFCPALLQNLSPVFGNLIARILTFAILLPSSSVVMNALSTIPTCPFFGTTDESIYVLLTGSNVALPIIIVC